MKASELKSLIRECIQEVLSEANQKPCTHCNGSGQVRVKSRFLQDMKPSAQCGYCKGTGKSGKPNKTNESAGIAKLIVSKSVKNKTPKKLKATKSSPTKKLPATTAKSPLKPDAPVKSKVAPTSKPEPQSPGKPTTPPAKGHKWVRNIMNGAWVQEPEDLPYYCSVGSETYWSS